MSHLCRQNDEGNSYHYDHEELRWPYLRYEVPIAHGGECYHNKISCLEQVEVTVAGALEMLNPANADNNMYFNIGLSN